MIWHLPCPAARRSWSASGRLRTRRRGGATPAQPSPPWPARTWSAPATASSSWSRTPSPASPTSPRWPTATSLPTTPARTTAAGASTSALSWPAPPRERCAFSTPTCWCRRTSSPAGSRRCAVERGRCCPTARSSTSTATRPGGPSPSAWPLPAPPRIAALLTGRRFTSSQGGALWVDAALYHAIGGYDERFRGWGCEDREICRRLERAAGTLPRLGGCLLHLDHPRPDESGEAARANAQLWARLRSCQAEVTPAGPIGDPDRYSPDRI